MKIPVFSIIALAAIYLMSCLTSPPTFEEKAVSAGITIIRIDDEKKPIMTELLSTCSPVGRIESLPIEQEGDHIINRALDLGANVVHIYYGDYYLERTSGTNEKPKFHYIVRFWKCKQPIDEKKEK